MHYKNGAMRVKLSVDVTILIVVVTLNCDDILFHFVFFKD
jgi:hypothetical protein